MKISAVINIIKKYTAIYCGMKDKEQWIATGKVAYNISSLPELNKEQLLTMLGIPEKNKAKYDVYGLPANFVGFLSKDGTREKAVSRGTTNIVIAGDEYEPVIVENRVYFIDVKYYKPFEGIEWDIYAVIGKNDEVMMAVKAGFLYLGYIIPSNIRTDFIALDLALITETIKRQKEIELLGEFSEDEEEYDEE